MEGTSDKWPNRFNGGSPLRKGDNKFRPETVDDAAGSVFRFAFYDLSEFRGSVLFFFDRNFHAVGSFAFLGIPKFILSRG